jgi:hypothetical protein
MKYTLHIFLLLVLLSSCAKIPVQSVSLLDALADEAGRMHQINIALLNGLFQSKREKIDDFIKTQYTPKFVSEFQKNIPPGADVKAELPNILNALAPRINERRDAMQVALEEQRLKLAGKLELDYSVFTNAASELRRLLVSAARVDQERQALYARAKELSKGSIDLNSIGNAIDRFIVSGGNVGADISNLNDAVNSILKNK